MPVILVPGKHTLQLYTGAVAYQIPGIYCSEAGGHHIEHIVYKDSSGYRATIVSGLVVYLKKTKWSSNYNIDQRFVITVDNQTIEDGALFLVEEHKEDLRGFQLEGCYQFPNDDKDTLRFHRPASNWGAPIVKTKAPIRNAVKVATRIAFGMWDMDFIESVSSRCYTTDGKYIVYEESQVESETAAFRAYPSRAYQVVNLESDTIVTDARRTESLISNIRGNNLEGLLSALQIVPSNDTYRNCMQFVWLYEQLKKRMIHRNGHNVIDNWVKAHRNEIAHADVTHVEPEIFRELQHLALKIVLQEKKT